MFYRLIGFCCLLIATAAPAYAFGDEAPAWLKQAAAQHAPTYKRDVPAVVLLKESTATVETDGRMTTVSNYVVRILTREGRAYASSVVNYDVSTDKVREMRAWLIRPDGSIRKYGKDETVDKIAASYDLYNESRQRVISAYEEAEAGSVFGYTTTTEERPKFPQTGWAFQGRVPVLVSRMTLVLPTGWQANAVTFNAPRVEPTVTGTSYTWEMRSLAPIEPEEASPSIKTLAPHIAINYGPTATGAPAPTGTRTFEKWTDVSRWYTELADPQAEPDDAVAMKARELTANAKTELEKIQAIGRYVQNIQYVSIQIGIGGYRPHAATEVLAKNYGDCKDKATLMRAMLRAVKLQSYAVLIYSGDRTSVREEWVSPTQFNHCIVAVRISDETQVASVVVHPSLGRLLIFDATDDTTPVGDLPDHEQGSFALVAAGDTGTLLRMPILPPEASRNERQTEVSLSPDGSITATLVERRTGQSAASLRSAFKGLSRPQFQQLVERWVNHGASGAKISKVEPADEHTEGRFRINLEFSADRYAQSLQNRLLVFKPAIVGRGQTMTLSEPTRKHPVVLESEAYTETVRFRLPEGFDVDELPDATKLESAFATYSATYEVKDGQLVFTRVFTQRAGVFPAEQYATVRDFYGRIRAAEEAPVVLAKK
jgi:transglutaminase-like putative cysteine protease